MLVVWYYPGGDGAGPVKQALESLAMKRPQAYARLRLDLHVLGIEGLRAPRLTLRYVGQKLWELKRRYEGIEYRLFFGVSGGAVWVVHLIEKKSAKTPRSDLALARRRLQEVIGP